MNLSYVLAEGEVEADEFVFGRKVDPGAWLRVQRTLLVVIVFLIGLAELDEARLVNDSTRLDRVVDEAGDLRVALLTQNDRFLYNRVFIEALLVKS